MWKRFRIVIYANLCTAVFIVFASSFLENTQAYCSLEKMKKFAMEACEHLFLVDDAREKRSLSSENYMLNNIEHYTKSDKKFNYNMRRSIYPKGGYLKVGRFHFNKLSRVDILPKYKSRHMSVKYLDVERFKREHSMSYNNIPYCCYNNCDEDFFC